MDNILEVVRGLFTHETSEFIDAIRSHRRFRLRSVAITSAAVGSVLNFFLLFTCVVGNVRTEAPRILTGCAYIPLVLSILWHNLDLTSRKFLRQDVPPLLLICIDALGFLGFLTIIIANGVICDDYYGQGGFVVMLAYNSVFWIICCACHGIIVLQTVLQTSGMLIHSFATPHRCASCGQGKSSYHGASQSLLGVPADYEDVEDARAASNLGPSMPTTDDTRGPPRP